MVSFIPKGTGKHIKAVIPPQVESKYPLIGAEMIPQKYFLAALVGPPKSGKSNTIYDMLVHFCGPSTRVLVFATKAFTDANWAYIRQWLKDNKIKHSIHTDIVDKDGNDLLQAFSDAFDLQHEQDLRDSSGAGPTVSIAARPLGGGYRTVEADKPKFYPTLDPFLVDVGGVTKTYVPTIIIFDDQGKMLKNDSRLQQFAKTYRHMLCSMIFSSQDVTDNSPDLRNIIEHWYIYKRVNEKRLRHIYEAVGPGITEEQFVAIYKAATKKNHSYLHIDATNMTMSKDDQAVIDLNKDEDTE